MPELVNIDEIIVKNRKRSLQDISELKESIRELGLLNPITINSDMTLIAGHHRLQACKGLNCHTISAIIIDANEIKAELMEIDENIIRRDLTALERAEQLKRRKEIYEKLYPHSNESRNQYTAKRNNFAEQKTFTEDTAQKTGKSQRAIQQDIQIANNISEEVKEEIKRIGLDNKKTALLQIAKAPVEEQKEIAELLKIGASPIQNKELNPAYKVDFFLRKVVVDGIWLDLPPNYDMDEACYSKMFWDANSYSKQNVNIS